MNEEIMDNKTNTMLKKGVVRSFEVLESTQKIIMSDLLMKSNELLKIVLNGESKTRKEEGDALVKSIEKDQKKVEKLSELIKLREECIKLFDED